MWMKCWIGRVGVWMRKEDHGVVSEIGKKRKRR